MLLEAMLCGLPVIAFNVSSNSEIVADGETGYLVPAYDIDKLCEAVERLRTNPEKAREMGHHAYRAQDVRCGRVGARRPRR